MIKIQIQLPDTLYAEAKRIAHEREISFAEVMRRGIEYVVTAYPRLHGDASEWTLPEPVKLGRFLAPEENWRNLANE